MEPLVARVGPAGSVAADGAFGVALTTLWQRTASVGDGALGFVPPVERPAVAARAALVVDALKRGQTHAFAATAGRTLAGFAQLTPGWGSQDHTATLSTVMVDPQWQRLGLGRRMVRALLALAVDELAVQHVELAVRAEAGLREFYRPFGFQEAGRRPGWIRVAPGDDRDQLILVADLSAR